MEDVETENSLFENGKSKWQRLKVEDLLSKFMKNIVVGL